MMEDDVFAAAVAELARAAEQYRDSLSADRQKAQDYYAGVMTDLPHRKGWSQAVSKDVHATICKTLPSVMRTFFGGEILAEYQPAEQDDTDRAQQITEYINMVVVPEAHAEVAVQDAIEDALKQRNGILKAWFDKRRRVAVSDHTGLDEAKLAELVQGDDVEVLNAEQKPDDLGPTYDVRIKRVTDKGRIAVAAVPPEEFLIHPDALCIEDSLLVGQWRRVPRSDLVAMGYEREQVYALAANATSASVDGEKIGRRPDHDMSGSNRGGDRANELVDYYELYVRLDHDDDGIAELRRCCFAGGFAVANMLENEYADEDDIPYYDVVSKRKPHQWEGHSLTDEVMDIQRIKTALLRYALDNIYWQNTLQPVVNIDEIENPEDVLSPEFGKPIRIKSGRPVGEVLQWRTVPFVAEHTIEMMGYWNDQIKDRTGVSDASSGLPPDALQNVTAKATAMLEQAGINHVEMLCRTLARSLKRFFKGLLKLTIKHQDKPRTVRLRGKWAEIDPRQWNAGMDVVINTGLGAGTRERDMMMMQIVLNVQEKIVTTMGPDNPLVKLEHIYEAVEKLIMAAGLRGVQSFIAKPTPEEVQTFMEKIKNRPDPEMVKAQAAMALEKQKTDAAISREAAQMEADKAVSATEAQQSFALEHQKMENTLTIEREKMELEREKMHMDHGMRKEEMGMKGESAMMTARLKDDASPSTEGKPKAKAAEHTEKIDALYDMLGAFLKAQSAKRRVVRNKETNEIEGIEPVYEDAA